MYELGSLFSLNSCCLLLCVSQTFCYCCYKMSFPFTKRSRCDLLLQICKVTISQMHCSSSGGEEGPWWPSSASVLCKSPYRGFRVRCSPHCCTTTPVHITLAPHVNCKSFRGLETRTPIPYSICTKDFEWVTS